MRAASLAVQRDHRSNRPCRSLTPDNSDGRAWVDAHSGISASRSMLSRGTLATLLLATLYCTAPPHAKSDDHVPNANARVLPDRLSQPLGIAQSPLPPPPGS